MEWFWKVDGLLDEILTERRKATRVRGQMDDALVRHDYSEFKRRSKEFSAIYDRIHSLEAELFAA